MFEIYPDVSCKTSAGGRVIRNSAACYFHVCDCDKFQKRKKAASVRCLFPWRRYFLFHMGCNKKLYNVLGGVTSIIVAQHMKKVFTNIGKYLQSFYAYCENDIMYFVKNGHE